MSQGRGLGSGPLYWFYRSFANAGRRTINLGGTGVFTTAEVMAFGAPLQQLGTLAAAGGIPYPVFVGSIIIANWIASHVITDRAISWSHNGKGKVYETNDPV
jgi:hypothetical protein